MRTRPMGQVYFLRAGDDGPIKIGYTTGSVWIRVSALQQSAPDKLNWLGAYIAQPEEERRLHKLFGAHRRRAEWFEPHSSILSYIGSMCPDFNQDEYLEYYFRVTLQNRIRGICNYKRSDWIGRMAEAGGVDIYNFRKWLDCRRILNQEQLENIETVLVEITEIDAEASA